MLDVRVIENDSLIVGRLTGTLDNALLKKTVQFVEVKEAQIEKGFNRFCDLTGLEEIHLGLGAVEAIAARRRAYNPNRVRVKSAFLAAGAMPLAIVELYRQLLKSPRIEVRSFTLMKDAAAWLGVKPRTLGQAWR
jgi:hypothetical protein